MKKLSYLVVFILAVSVFAAMACIFTPATVGQSDRGQCQQQCTEQYKKCMMTANSNHGACQHAFTTCKTACRTDTNTNGNGNTNTNTNTNHNSGL